MPIDPPTNYYVPHIYETTHKGERGYDIWSRLLIDRIIFLGTPIDDQIANVIIAQLLYLESQDPEKDIYMYVNSPGGVITAGMAIYDTMNYIRPDVATICVGQAASMGAVLLAGGAKGKRRALPHSRILIHQPLGSVRGQATDIEIQAQEIMRWKKTLNETLAKDTGQTVEQVAADTERDRIMGPVEAKEYGLVDEVINVAHPDGEA